MSEFDSLRSFSARIGSDPLLVQAAGGNTSLKRDGVMWIKASGTWLKDAAAREVFVPVDHTALMAALSREDPRCETCTDFLRTDLATTDLRPSIETTVHALLPQKVVIHVHCVNTIAWAIQADAESFLATKLKGFASIYIPYARPGLPLAGAIAGRLRAGIDVLVLGNHGLVVAAGSVDAAGALLNRVVEVLRRPARAAAAPDLEALGQACLGTDYRPVDRLETHALATDELALARGANAVYYPDHVVFLGMGVATGLASDAPLVALPGIGVLLKESAKPAIEPMGRCLADVMRRIAPADSLNELSAHDIDQLVNWDAEKYRQTLDAGDGISHIVP
jgi:rhamnose utilization protein RhaD (predicted bifunctional aldolase and dehydrogenase)